jgi:hypothetical protein
MANFVQGNFVVPATPEDSQVFIKDKFGRIRFTIAPHQVTATFVKNNLIHVKSLGTDNVILIDFGNTEEAKRALPELQSQLDIAKKSPPLQVDPAIIEYIENYLNGKISFMYHQISATNSWGISHSFGYKPNVTVTDETFEEIEGLIKYIDNNQLYVKFNQNLTGWVFCS